MDGGSESMGAGGDGWWTLGEAAQRANVSHLALQVWINSGDLPCEVAWREGVSVRVVRPADLAALVPGLDPGPVPGDASLDQRSLHRGEIRSQLGSDASGEPDAPLSVEEGEEPHEAELRREVARLRKEVLELRSARMIAEIRGEAPRSSRSPGRPAPGPVPAASSAGSIRPSRWPILRAAAIGLALGLVTAAGWSQLERGVVEAASSPSSADEAPSAVVAAGLELPHGAPSSPAPETSVSPEPGVVESTLETPRSAQGGEVAVQEARPSSPFPVMLRVVDPTAYVDAGAPEAAGAFHVLWEDGDGRYRSALGPCIGSHNAEGRVRGSHRVDGAACCAHHAFVERMTGATRDEESLRQLVAEAEASRAEGVVPPLMRLRAERSARRFLGHALTAQLGLSSWASAGLDGDSGEHSWMLDPAGDAMRLTLRSWVVPLEGDVPLPFELDLRMGDGPDGDEGLAFRWIER